MPEPTPQTAGPSILLLHGAGLGGWMWDAQRTRLSATHEVLTPDLPGHGANSGTDYTTNADAVDGLAQLLESHGGGPAAVLGFSLGGQLALELACRYPTLVDRVSVVSSLMLPLRWPGGAAWSLRATAPLARWRLFADFQAKTSYIPEAQFDAYYASSTSVSQASLYAIGRENFGFRIPQEWPDAPGAPLLIAGEKEPAILRRGMKELHAQHERSTLELLPDVGHGVSLQRPDWFSDRLESWLNRPSGPAD